MQSLKHVGVCTLTTVTVLCVDAIMATACSSVANSSMLWGKTIFTKMEQPPVAVPSTDDIHVLK